MSKIELENYLLDINVGKAQVMIDVETRDGEKFTKIVPRNVMESMASSGLTMEETMQIVVEVKLDYENEENGPVPYEIVSKTIEKLADRNMSPDQIVLAFEKCDIAKILGDSAREFKTAYDLEDEKCEYLAYVIETEAGYKTIQSEQEYYDEYSDGNHDDYSSGLIEEEELGYGMHKVTNK